MLVQNLIKLSAAVCELSR